MGAAMKTIGVIGAGQLGLMLAEEAHKLGARVVTLDPAADAPAARVADGHIVAAYDDGAALEELCRRSDVVTYEFENVPGEVLIPLVERYNIPQGFQPLYDSQDRLREKRNAVAHGLRTPRFAPADDRPSLEAAVREAGGFPCVFKTRTLGYDGHGQVVFAFGGGYGEGRTLFRPAGYRRGVRSLRFRGERHRGRRRPRDGLLSRGAQRPPRRDSGSVGRAGGDSGRRCATGS